MFSFLFGINLIANIIADKITTMYEKIEGVGDIRTAIIRITIRDIIFIIAFFVILLKIILKVKGVKTYTIKKDPNNIKRRLSSMETNKKDVIAFKIKAECNSFVFLVPIKEEYIYIPKRPAKIPANMLFGSFEYILLEKRYRIKRYKKRIIIKIIENSISFLVLVLVSSINIMITEKFIIFMIIILML
jgi:hypothetical protein